MMLDYISWMVTSLIILLFKKNQDMFSCFSKIDELAKITMFQQPLGDEKISDKTSIIDKGERQEYDRRFSKQREDLLNKQMVNS